MQEAHNACCTNLPNVENQNKKIQNIEMQMLTLPDHFAHLSQLIESSDSNSIY